jgi:hypothetical protein
VGDQEEERERKRERFYLNVVQIDRKGAVIALSSGGDRYYSRHCQQNHERYGTHCNLL